MGNLIEKMTLEEKASLVCGGSFWMTNAIERLGIPSLLLTDGPHGLRKQEGEADHLGLNQSVPSVCFPAACASSSSFNRPLLKKMGHILGRIAKQESVNVLLGPAMNIKRSPLCGRNFEYISEDPYLTGELASVYVEGVQSEGVGTSPKHFALNNQEFFRMTNSSNVDEQTMREIYLRAFEKVVKTAHPYTMMAAYNKINGTYACDNAQLLQTILREEWGFDGVVVSDWLASNNRVSNLTAGLDLSMPGSHGEFEAEIVAAVQEGKLAEAALNQSCQRMLQLINRTSQQVLQDLSLEEAHTFAREVAEESIVLLENDGTLPLKRNQSVTFVGPFAKAPRYQGGGSSHINAYRVVGAFEAAAQEGIPVKYVEGYTLDEKSSSTDLCHEALLATQNSDVVVVFAGLPDTYESEGYDRTHLNLPENQNQLIEALIEAGRSIIVVLHQGAPVILPWRQRVNGVVGAYLGGEAIGEAVVSVLYGMVNPSARLAETWPLQLSDTPSFEHFANDPDNTDYVERLLVGYRHYVTKDIPVQYDFGHGLSYTEFQYDTLTINEQADELHITVTVSNVGAVSGSEVVQVYCEKPHRPGRPMRELVGFEKITLDPGEAHVVSMTVNKADLRIWNTNRKNWQLLSGEYRFAVGQTARHMILSSSITLDVPEHFTKESTFASIAANAKAQQTLEAMMAPMMQGQVQPQEDQSGAINQQMMQEMMKTMPLHALISAVPTLKTEHIEMMVQALNQSQQ